MFTRRYFCHRIFNRIQATTQDTAYIYGARAHVCVCVCVCVCVGGQREILHRQSSKEKFLLCTTAKRYTAFCFVLL